MGKSVMVTWADPTECIYRVRLPRYVAMPFAEMLTHECGISSVHLRQGNLQATCNGIGIWVGDWLADWCSIA